MDNTLFLKIPPEQLMQLRTEVIKRLSRDEVFLEAYRDRHGKWIEHFTAEIPKAAYEAYANDR